MDAFGFDWAICDGLNESGLSVGTLWLPETKLPTDVHRLADLKLLDSGPIHSIPLPNS
ncbi:MAG: hypothetical protein Q8P61_09710 [Candidatus Nanopelagicales bacterium]|nr:hypothetical protein [Candidatus Nanopelagicales bacterium]